MAKLTPMMEQYFKMKEKYPDTILFFRLGDFYEMFFQDAIAVSQELNLTLTTRDRNKPEAERTPMCGIPYHASEGYLSKLVAKGYKVAICEQMELPSESKGIVSREVVRVVTAGTVMESSMLEEDCHNYLAVVYTPSAKEMVDHWGDMVLCFCDISTGSLSYRIIPMGEEAITHACNELHRFSPREVILSPEATAHVWLRDFLKEGLDIPWQEGFDFTEAFGKSYFKKQFPQKPMVESKELLCCLGGLFSYLKETQKMDLLYISNITPLQQGEYMEISLETKRNLELFETLWAREKKGSLLWVLDKTKTSMGGRLLREWLQRPLMDLYKIQKRQSAVAELKEKFTDCQNITELLREIPDLERIVARISYGSASPKDLRGLAEGLDKITLLRGHMQPFYTEHLLDVQEDLEDLPQLKELLLAALNEELPTTVREGGMIQRGFHEELDKLCHIMDHGGELLADLETKTKEATGIRNLRVKYHRGAGYYIEVSKGQSSQVPTHWARKQTLANSERFISDELKELEHMILTAKDQVNTLEYSLFKKLQEEVLKFTEIIQKTAVAVAHLDVLQSLAVVATKGNYVAPELLDTGDLFIRNGRHPVVEAMMKDGLFVPNDSHFSLETERSAIITGANMAGKSTYMRQVALIVLMTQIGSFVPAYSAQIGIVDQIFTRIGASDDLAAGRSTFMVEMSEVATLLSCATSQSLLILDEIGRGTSTYDGMALAKAVLEHCHNKIKGKTLFATHYHELSSLEADWPAIKNYNLAAKQQGEQLIFLRKIQSGGADQSYGIQVAQLAGVPEEVIARAKAILQELETGDAPRPLPKAVKAIEKTAEELEIEKKSQALWSQLQHLDLDDMTPKQAWELLANWKQGI